MIIRYLTIFPIKDKAITNDREQKITSLMLLLW